MSEQSYNCEQIRSAQHREISISEASKESVYSYNSVKGQNEPKQEENHVNKQQDVIEEEGPSQRRPRRLATNENDVKQEKEEDITMGMQVVDLSRYLFNGIVQLCRRQELISQDLAHSFLTNHTIGIDKKYIQLYKAGKLSQFDFQKCKISVIDHRRLIDMLVQTKPQKYKPLGQNASPYDFVKETQEFLKEIYAMNENDYYRQLQEQAIRHCQSWWGGPEKITPLVDPPLKFYQTEQGQKIRIQKEKAIIVETAEEEKERNKRISNQRTTNQDLKDIGKSLVYKLYGQKVKIENDSSVDSKSASGSASEPTKADKTKRDDKNSKSKKHKKDKKIKKEKKDKKDKKKDKKHKSSKSKREPVQAKEEANSTPQDMQLYDETKNSNKK